GTTVVFISPVAVTPRELEKDWVLVDVPLPDREELANVLDAVAPEEAGRSFERDRLAGAALGLTRRESLRAFRRAQHVAELNNALGRGTDWESVVIAEKRRLMSAATALEFCEPGANLDDIGGLDTLKRWVHERRAAFSDDARQFGLPQPKGLMLVGVQGCGKSLAAKAVAGFWGIPLVRLDLGALFSGSVAPDDALREAIRSTEAMAPCVLWVDEIEKGFSEGDAETSRVLGSLLVWLQEKQSAVFLVATANQVDKLPPELLRRGRFDELFFVDLPDQHARRQILAIHLGRRGRSGFDVDELAGKTQNFSGAELEQVVIAAMYRAFADDREVSQADLTLAAKQLIPLYKLRETDVKALRTWAHERARPAGHDRKLSDLFDG
ncbi:MAG: SpoVK/Ycf46/Vps4 family AAA+-type ATPase, partial [Bradymonadia bacterium]